ncbi:CHRD domain-containing protein [Lewinella sp. JB7]|uniref:CHRD domain-containing protein n=1 Tax=Lewinella sp. JB7 TaxID=2962887 RepID=UPI0020CA1CB7|nr:CHRD domain-containing protein [Lewinella sp. JB7]MCP9237629.1 CHRD domain-containing protein [Lewinella sp. JB7]
MQHLPTTLLFFICSLLLATVPVAAQIPASGTALLSGQQEVLPVATAATGSVRVEFAAVGSEDLRVTVSGSFENLSSPVATEVNGGAHLHIGYPGRNGGVVIPLSLSLAEDSLSATLTAESNVYTVALEDLAGLDPGELYVNVHSQNYPGGELRGAVLRDEYTHYFTNLLGSNEVPSVMSEAAGALLFQVDEEENEMIVTGSFNDLSDTLATSISGGVHLHFGLPGQNGPVRISLTPTLDEDRRSGTFRASDNTIEITEEQMEALRDGRVYANVHSGAYPGGELRGQVLPPADAILRGHLAGANEWPVVTSTGSGQVLAHLSGTTLRVVGSFAEITSPVATTIGGGAHLHPGMAGMNGPVAFPLTLALNEDSLGGVFSLVDNEYELSEAQRTQLLDRGMYLNIHTEAHRSGELRGQMLPESQAVFTAFLNGNQEVPAVSTTGRGLVKVEKMGSRMTVTGSFTELMSDLNRAIANGAHLHAGYPGQNGPVIYRLAADVAEGDGPAGVFMPAHNTFTLSGGRADTLNDRFFYANIHSLDHPGGEIRGNLLAEAESYFLAPLSGASEPVGVPTDAHGLVAAEVTDSTVILVGSFADLDSDFAADVAGGMHLHQAIAGSNGGILTAINTEIEDDNRSGEILADSNRLSLTTAGLEAMLDRRIYANVHTAAYRGGAIRGQLLPLAGSYFHTTFSGVNEPGYVETSARGGLKLELIDSTLRISGSVTMLEGDFDASVAGGAHLHLAPAGENGPIEMGLNADPADDLKSATFVVDSNTFVLTTEQLDDLRAGLLYANVHTTMVRSGEARGQLLVEPNFAPAASDILSPAEADSLDISGDTNQTFEATFTSAMDADGDTVVYIWQLATDEAFTNLVYAANTGRDTSFSASYGALDTLLAQAGVENDSATTLYHRVLTSDGSNHRPGAAATIILTRDGIVGTRDYRPAGFAASAFPNPVTVGEAINYEVTTRQAFRGTVQVHNQLGQLRTQLAVESTPGGQRYRVATDGYPAGTYFLTLRDTGGHLIDVLRVIVR